MHEILGKIIRLTFFWIFFLPSMSTQPTNCVIRYNNTHLPPDCDNSSMSCDFQEGLANLIVANSTDNQFLLCLFLNDFQVTLGANMRDAMPTSIYLEAKQIMLQYNYTLINYQKIVFQATDMVYFSPQSMLSGELVWIECKGQVNLNNSKVQNVSYIASDCDCQDQAESDCSQVWDLNIPQLYQPGTNSEDFNLSIFTQQIDYNSIGHNTIVIVAGTEVIVEASSLISSIVGIYSPNISLTGSIISTTGNGFPSASGIGCGFFDQILNQLLGCTGSGGSHGGYGGNSWPDNCNLMISRQPYQAKLYPIMPGSGGGFFLPDIKDASSGGGVINIQTKYLAVWNSTVQANGKPGTQGGGGGAGGSVALDYISIEGNSKITANGGGGKSSGGGGRVWLWNHNWRYQINNQNLQDFTISSEGGPNCQGMLSCGENGSITTSPCQPGFQLNLQNFICQECPLGSYQSLYGYSECQACSNKPSDSYYVKGNQSKLYKDACQFQCNEGYTRIKNVCYDNFSYLTGKIGGINMLISVGIIVAVVVGYLIILLFQKLSQKDLFLKKKEQDQFERRMHFKVEDIPYHEKRIYFSGQNRPGKPWFIPQETQLAYGRTVLPPVTKLDGILFKAIKEINQICKFSKKLKAILFLTKFYYYPLSKYLEALYREKKSERVAKYIVQINKKVPQVENLGIKFHVQPYLSAGCIEIFNYSRSALDFYIQNYFPIYFQLERMPLGGYAIDLNDPFMKAFISEIDQKSQNRLYQRYINELDELLRNSEQLVPILNHLWTMTEENPQLQAYLYQSGGCFLGIDKNFRIDSKKPLFLVFTAQNANKNHFIFQNELFNTAYHDQVTYFKHQYNFRQEVIQDDKKSIFWEIDNNLSEKVLSWSLGVLTIFLLLLNVIGFFLLMFIAGEDKVRFTYGIVLYFLLAPFNEFLMVFQAFKLILSKNCKVLSHSIYFTLTDIFKFLVLSVLGLVENISQEFSDVLMEAIFYLWIVNLVGNGVSLFLQLLLHPHYSRHRTVVDLTVKKNN